MAKASVAVAIIAKDSARTIAACLNSLVPHVKQVVVCVDERTTDDTAKLAFAHGAKVVTGLKVSDWHECPQHGRVLAQDFARARQESFGHLRRDVDWHGWVDADDVVQHGDRLAEYLATLPAEVDGVWLPYVYARTPNGKTTTLFDRERLIRTSRAWEWEHRVHEVLRPVEGTVEVLNWARTEDVVIVHQDQGHDTAGSARRNILLLEIALEEKPGDPWALFYLGNQYFALGQWGPAVECYEASTQHTNVYQLWQTLVYLSMAYEKLGAIDEAKGAALRCLDVRPEHPEPYYRMAALCMLTGEADKCEFWTRLGDRMRPPPPFAFRNPLDGPFNARLTLGQAYINAGHVSQAKRQFEQAYSIVPEKNAGEAIAYCRSLEDSGARANALVKVLEGRPDAEVVELWQRLDPPTEVRQFGRVRDVVMPAMLRGRVSTQPRIVFWCGRSLEPWAPPSVNTTGIGGSETAVIQIAQRFAQDGWRVDVYNDPDRMEGEYEGVGYWDCRRAGLDERTEVFVSWRNPRVLGALPIQSVVSLLWCHDLHSGPTAAEHLARFGRVLGVSDWHAHYLASCYDLSPERVDYVPNGVELSRFAGDVSKVPWRCVYASSPDRGLDRLLAIWPAIVEAEPQAELHIAYGWETIDRSIQAGAADLIPLKARIEALLKQTPRVVWRGRLPQGELAKLYQESYAWTYPTSFTEVSCISAMEAMAGGCVPVTSAVGALPETIGDAGALVTGNTYTPAWQEWFGAVVRGILTDRGTRLDYAARGRERARGLTWDAAYEKWKEVVGGVLVGEREAVLA